MHPTWITTGLICLVDKKYPNPMLAYLISSWLADPIYLFSETRRKYKGGKNADNYIKIHPVSISYSMGHIGSAMTERWC